MGTKDTQHVGKEQGAESRTHRFLEGSALNYPWDCSLFLWGPELSHLNVEDGLQGSSTSNILERCQDTPGWCIKAAYPALLTLWRIALNGQSLLPFNLLVPL